MTNVEYMVNLLNDFMNENDIEFHEIRIDDGGASEESMICYNVACPYCDGDERCECKDTGPVEMPTREMCSECKYKWLASEVDE